MSQKGEMDFHYSKIEVLNALVEVISTINSMKIVKIDEINGFILIKTDLSMFSWGEDIPIYITEISPRLTRISVTSTPKFDPIWKGKLDLGKNKNNIEIIFDSLYQFFNANASAKTLQNKAYLNQDHRICSMCGLSNPADSNFCGECGTQL